jgi:hypothetical protein
MTDSILVFLLDFGIQLLFLTNLDFTQKIMRALDAMHARGHIDNKTMEYLTPEDLKPGRFYLLACVKLSVLGTCTSTLCLISDLIRLMTDSSLVFLLGFGIQCMLVAT